MTRKQAYTYLLRTDSSAYAVLTALATARDGSLPVAEFHRILGKLHASEYGVKATKTRLITEGVIEIRIAITQAGIERHARSTNPPRKRSCAKPAATVAKKATSPTAAPVDSTPLALAWMGRP